eukprot:m.39844 g.39844  ORF g.39844 m.39844 type:complete len:167 (+) comp14757_c0_seq2:49-549(+)
MSSHIPEDVFENDLRTCAKDLVHNTLTRYSEVGHRFSGAPIGSEEMKYVSFQGIAREGKSPMIFTRDEEIVQSLKDSEKNPVIDYYSLQQASTGNWINFVFFHDDPSKWLAQTGHRNQVKEFTRHCFSMSYKTMGIFHKDGTLEFSKDPYYTSYELPTTPIDTNGR